MKAIVWTIVVILLSYESFSQSNNKELSDNLPPPHATKSSMNFSNVIGWKEDQTPKAPPGFTVTRLADGFENPRWLYITPNGDILVAESNSNYSLLKKIGGWIIGASRSNNLHNSADRITILRDSNGDGKPDTRQTFLAKLNQPLGMLVLDNWFYVANTDAVWRYPYKPGQLAITDKGQKVIDLPAGKINQHWTRNIIASKDGKKLYIAVGSGTNIADKGIKSEYLRADILEVNPDGSGLKVYASGLRNPVGMDWAVDTNTLWTVVNERDGLGDDLVPDYLTSVKEDGFYGWPWIYHGRVDERVKEPKPGLLDKYIKPDVDVGAHTASLGLAFYDKKAFPEKYHRGAFIAQHGSWNRSVLSGYKVVFVPFDHNGKPTGKDEDFLTGFVADLDKEKVHGRPVCVLVTPDGSLLVTDDTSNVLWKVSVAK